MSDLPSVKQLFAGMGVELEYLNVDVFRRCCLDEATRCFTDGSRLDDGGACQALMLTPSEIDYSEDASIPPVSANGDFVTYYLFDENSKFVRIYHENLLPSIT